MIQRARFVLLGASNVTLGFPWIVGCLEQIAHDADVVAAFGHGRSYGKTTRVLGRELASISDCGLWTALERAAPQPTYALVCDVGNDIMYGADPATIASWVERVIERLESHSARVAIAGLPIASLSELTPRRYRALRSILFPARHVDFEDALARARDLDARLATLARAHGSTMLVPERDWYGLDPIHIRRRARSRAWKQWIEATVPHDLAGAIVTAPPRRERHVAAWRLVPEERRLFGRLQTRAQPSVQLKGPLRIALY